VASSCALLCSVRVLDGLNDSQLLTQRAPWPGAHNFPLSHHEPLRPGQTHSPRDKGPPRRVQGSLALPAGDAPKLQIRVFFEAQHSALMLELGGVLRANILQTYLNTALIDALRVPSADH